MSRAFFVSDLHLFARRSEAPRYLEAIRRRAAVAATFVLGGDIFDFRWSTQATSGEAVEAAVAWLKQLTGECPGCHFYYLLGNHDYNDDFIRRLAELAPSVQNLSWHKFYLRLGGACFCTATRPTAAGRRRKCWLSPATAGFSTGDAAGFTVACTIWRCVPGCTARCPTWSIPAPGGQADHRLSGARRRGAAQRRAAHIFRPYPPADVGLPLRRLDLSQRRRADPRPTIPTSSRRLSDRRQPTASSFFFV